MAVIDELLVGLGFDFDATELDKFKRGVDTAKSVVSAFAKATVTASTALTGLTVASTAASAEQARMAEELNTSVANIEALGFAMSKTGGDVDDLKDDLREFSVKALEASEGAGDGFETFQRLGIAARDSNGNLRDSVDLMFEFNKKIQKFNESEKFALADKLQLQRSSRLLSLNSEELQNLIKSYSELNVGTEKDTKIALDFQDSLKDLWAIVKQVSKIIASELAPILTDLIDTFVDWWKINKDIVKQNIPEYIDKIIFAFKALTLVTGVFIASRLPAFLLSLINLFKAVQFRALLANAAILLIPALITAGVAAIGLLAQDAKTFFEGGESFIGDMIKKYPQWENSIRVIAGLFNGIYDVTARIFYGWEQIFKLINHLTEDTNDTELSTNVAKDVNAFANANLTPKQVIKLKEAGLITDKEIDVIKSGYADPYTIARAKEKLRKLGEEESSDLQPNLGNIDNNLVEPIRNPNVSQISETNTVQRVSENNTNVDKVEINVIGNSDPKATADEVSRNWQQTQEELQSNIKV